MSAHGYTYAFRGKHAVMALKMHPTAIWPKKASIFVKKTFSRHSKRIQAISAVTLKKFIRFLNCHLGLGVDELAVLAVEIESDKPDWKVLCAVWDVVAFLPNLVERGVG